MGKEKPKGQIIGNCMRCGNYILEEDKIWESCGLCDECRIKEQGQDRANYMGNLETEQSAEEVAWNKLKEAFPGKYLTLKKEYVSYKGKDRIEFAAYVDRKDGEKGKWSDDKQTPMEAVDTLIEIIKKEDGE